MNSVYGVENAEIVRVFPFDKCQRVMDIDGGNGHFLSEVLKKNAASEGAVFDLPEVIQRARQSALFESFAGRMSLIEGDVFKSVPEGFDLIMLRHVIHDWNDEECNLIIHNRKQALNKMVAC